MFKKSSCATALLVLAILPVHGFGSIPVFTQVQPPQPSFEVASIKPGTPGDRSGKFTTMQGVHEFVVKNYTVKDLIGFAYDLPLPRISGGPSWIDNDLFNILAAAAGEERPGLDQQMAMVRSLLDDRFQLRFHRSERELPVYELRISKNGPKLKESTAPADSQPLLTNRVFPGIRIETPARNVTMSAFASELQRAVLDRPVLDKTNLTARYDFDLDWTYDDTQFGGKLPKINTDISEKPSLFTALQTQLGLTLESSRAQVETLVIDSVQKPSDN